MRPKPVALLFGVVLMAAAAAAVLVLSPDSVPGQVLASKLGLPAQVFASNLEQSAQRPVASGCDQRHPVFAYGFGALRDHVGSRMGDPLECEQSIHVDGDTRQKTSTGYAYYRKDSNIPSFTDGWEHWALTSDGLVYWTGSVIDPPSAISSR